MAIRLKDIPSSVGSISAALADVDFGADGAFMPAASRSGSFSVALANVAASLSGSYIGTAERTGSISASLSGILANIDGSVIDLDPSDWISTPSPTFVYGIAGEYDLTQHLASGGIGKVVTLDAGTLPSGVSLDATDGAQKFVYDGVGPVATESGIVLGSSDVPVVGQLPLLTIAEGGAGKPWTVGHAFKKGDVPPGYFIDASGPSSFQADVRNWWDDGSVKFAVLSGIGGTSAQLTTSTSDTITGAQVGLVNPQAVVSLTNVKDWTFDDEPHDIGARLTMVNAGTYVSHSVTVDNSASVGATSATPVGTTQFDIVASISGGTPGGYQKVTFTLNYLDADGVTARTRTGTVVAYNRPGGGIEWSAADATNVHASDNSLPDITLNCPVTDTVGTWDRNTAHLVRKIAGPVMTERHYYVPATDVAYTSHIAAWFYVRSYVGGATEVETVIENGGWLLVANPLPKTYNASVSIGGTERYSSGIITHQPHTRWSRNDWLNPAFVECFGLHDGPYLRSTKLVPNYGWGSPSEATLNALFQEVNPTPFALGEYNAGYASGGDKEHIGILPHWTSLWAAATTTTDVRAVKSVIANARCADRYSHFWRDEATGRPVKIATNPAQGNLGCVSQDSVQTGWFGTGNTEAAGKIVPCGGAFPSNQVRDGAHAAQDYYAPYLLTGRWSFLDAEQNLIGAHNITLGGAVRNNGLCWFGPRIQTRHRGWMLRNLALCITMTPDSDSFRTELETIFANNMAWLKADYCDPATALPGYYEPAGWMYHYSATGNSGYGSYGVSSVETPYLYWWGAPWMDWFNVSALAWAKDLELPLTAQALSDLDYVFNHNQQTASGFAGDGSAGTYNYRHANVYIVPFGTDGYGSALEHSFDFGELYSTLLYEMATPALPPGTSLHTNLKWGGAGTSWPWEDRECNINDFSGGGSNFLHLASALAMAAHHHPDCLAGYNRLAASSTWANCAYIWNDYPKGGIAPR